MDESEIIILETSASGRESERQKTRRVVPESNASAHVTVSLQSSNKPRPSCSVLSLFCATHSMSIPSTDFPGAYGGQLTHLTAMAPCIPNTSNLQGTSRLRRYRFYRARSSGSGSVFAPTLASLSAPSFLRCHCVLQFIEKWW